MTGHWVSPVEHDRTRLVVILRKWNLTGNDRTLRSCVQSMEVVKTLASVFDRTLGHKVTGH